MGELLLCCAVLGCQPDPFYELGWNALSSAQGPDGDVPAPHFDPTSTKLATEPAAGAYRFETNYHPSLVAVLCALTTLEQYA